LILREIYLTSFIEAVKDINLQKSENSLYKTLFKIHIPPDWTYFEHFRKFN